MDGAVFNKAREDAWSRPLESFNVSDPSLYQNGTWGPYFERLRQEAPVHYCRESIYGPFWSVSRYKDIMKVDSDWQTYSSQLGGIQIEDQPQGMERPSFIRMDGPKHVAQRKVVSPIVGPNNLANMEKLIRERTCKVLDALPRGETFDWVERVSIPLTTMMLATLFDWPFERRNELTRWSDIAIANVRDPDAPVKSEEARFEELKKMAEAIAEIYNKRQNEPPKFDLLSMLAHGAATREMPLREFMGNLALLIVGGNDTTRNSMTGGLLALNEHPEQYEKLRRNPALVETMVPEIIRFITPVIHMRRTTRVDTELGGQRIKAGDKVIIWYVSGNRDPEHVERPDEFVIDRMRPREHTSFGFGVHRCVGNRLAEMQLEILWEEILQRFPRIDVVGEAKRTYSNFIHGIRSMPVRIPA